MNRTVWSIALVALMCLISIRAVAKCSSGPEIGLFYADPSGSSTWYPLWPSVPDTISLPWLTEGEIWISAFQDYDCSYHYQFSKNDVLVASGPMNHDWLLGTINPITGPGIYDLCAGTEWYICDRHWTIVVTDASEITPHCKLELRALLGGAAINGPNSTMRTQLRLTEDFPLTEPFTFMGWTDPTSGGESITGSMLDSTNTQPVVDWVRVELRSVENPNEVVHAINGLIHKNAVVTDADDHGLVFDVPPGFYHVAVRHRNHLPIVTEKVLLLPYSFYLYTNYQSVPVFGIDTRMPVPGSSNLALRPGNALLDEGPQRISYAGLDNDRDAILQRIGGIVPTAIVSGYYNEDLNMDGVVKYAGANNDRDVILQAIGGTVPTAVVVE